MHMMILPMVQALQYRAAKQSVRPLADLKMDGIVGSGSQIRTCFEMVGQAARSEANVLIRGETGTGKELIALAIHKNSSRAERSFVVVDCAALADTLVESILFGYEKNAFTGAEKARDGLIKQADGGTLFLDEVGELSLSVQKAFLRVLQEHRFRPVGGQREVESEFRLVAATNRDLGEMAKAGLFRSDLFFRLQGVVIELPPLRDRGEDIKELAIFHMKRLCQKYGIEKKEFSLDFLQALSLYYWPGNVRELVNSLENILATARYDPVIYPKHLPTDIRVKIARALSGMGLNGDEETKSQPANAEYPQWRDYRSVMDREYLNGLLKKTENNIGEACRISGISRSRLYALLKLHRLTVS
jgi:two-component system NtrC family response regulator